MPVDSGTRRRERYAHVPSALRDLNQWVAWRRDRRNGKWTKVPVRVTDGRTSASVDDPRTWGSFEEALKSPVDRVQGLGFVFTDHDPLCGLDFDACINGDGELHPVADELLRSLGGYQERSPSGRGMHAIVEARLGPGRKTSKTPWDGDFEVYDRGRFFTVTGQGQGKPTDVQSAVDAAILRIFGKPKSEDLGEREARTVAELFAEHPKLEVIAKHDGVPPRDESGSGWDHYLACEAVRCDLTRDEFAAIVRSARGDRKALRADYVKRTWTRAEEKVAADEKDPARRLNLRYNLRGDAAIVRGDPISDIASGAGKVYLYAQNGARYRIPYLDDLFDAAKHTRIVSQATRSRFGLLSPKEAVDLAQTVIELCGGTDADPLTEARIVVIEFIAHAGSTVEVVGLDGERKTQWEVLDEIVQVEATLESRRDLARRSVIIHDRDNDELWLPAGALRDYGGGRRSGLDFISDLAEIGWRHQSLDAWEPGSHARRKSGELRHIHRNFYVGKD